MMIYERGHNTIKDRIPPLDEYRRGIPDEECERRFVVEETVSISHSMDIQLFKLFINLPAETGTAAVRDGIPATGRDRVIVPLSELSRDLTVDGLGRAKNKKILNNIYSINNLFD